MKIIKFGSRGSDVKALQRKLHLAEDGIFGVNTREAVIAFQKQNGLTPDGIVGERTRAALEGTNTCILRRINEIILHCSATREGKDYTVADIRQWHLARNFADIGYHYVIYRDGSVHTGRPLSQAGAHCSGHNTNSIGVCYIGGYASDGKTPKDTRTPEQKKALRSLINNLSTLFPGATVHAHREYANKACPCFDVSQI